MYLLKVWIVWVSPSTAKPISIAPSAFLISPSRGGVKLAERAGGERAGRKAGTRYPSLQEWEEGMSPLLPGTD